MRRPCRWFVLAIVVACGSPVAAQHLVPTPPGAMWPGDACSNTKICHSYRGIRFFTPTTGYVFEPREMFKTTDAGRSWIPILGPRAGHPIGIGDVQFLDANTFFVTGSELLRTIDGGRTFTRLTKEVPSIWVPGGEMHEVSLVAFLDADYGLAVGTSSEGVPLMVTKDGGATWSVWVRLQPNVSPGGGLWMFDRKHGLMAGNRGIARTVDRGFSWDPVPGVPANAARRTRCTSGGACLAISGYHTAYISTDGGVTWKKTETGVDTDREIDFVNNAQIFGPNNAVIVGSHNDEPAFTLEGYNARTPLPTIPVQPPPKGFILRWDGTSWTRTMYPQFESIHAVDFVTKNEVWGSADFNGIIHSTDGGKTWALVLDYHRQQALTPTPAATPGP